MKEFNKPIKRKVVIKSSDKAIPDGEWIVTCGPDGVRVRRFGEHKNKTKAVTWKQVVSEALIWK